MPINSFLYPAPSTPSFAYEVANSLRFNDGSTDHLDKTFGQAGNRRTFTISFWAKLTGNNTPSQSAMFGAIFDAAQDGSNSDDLYFHTNRLNFSGYYGSTQFILRTTAKYRDPSAWYHFVVAFDTTQSTASNRIKIYANGVQETDFDDETYPAEDFQTSYINTDRLHNIGTLVDGDGFPFDGYLAEFVFIDGQALGPTSFGEFDSDSPNIWKPIDVSGLTFGTNGFYLDFENASSLGADVSGNSNNFTARNLTSVDQSTDTCTNNFATLNPLAVPGASNTFSEGNLEITNSADANRASFSTIGVSSGKWYYECKVLSGEMKQFIGISKPQESTIRPGDTAGSYGYSAENGKKYNNDSNASYGSSASSGDIIMVAFDADNGTIWVGKNGTWFNSATQSEIENGTTTNSMYSSITIDDFFMMAVSVEDSNVQMNFGSPMYSISSGNSDGNGYGNFEYSVPSGYYSINTKNLSEFG